ncbi:hypothetical protein LTS18_008527, partial [Coniosporium uncinatum]
PSSLSIHTHHPQRGLMAAKKAPPWRQQRTWRQELGRGSVIVERTKQSCSCMSYRTWNES